MDIALLWVQLLGVAGVILFFATKMTKAADVIATRTGIGRTFIGVVLLATATSFPELGTGVSSIVLFDQPDLAAGDVFGSNIFNLLIIGLVDLYWRHGPILQSVYRITTTSAIIGVFGILVMSVALIGLLFGDTAIFADFLVSPVSVLLFASFLVAMFYIYRLEKNTQRKPQQNVDDNDETLGKAVVHYLIAAAFVIGSSIWLASIGNQIVVRVGMDASFVGTQFLAFSTSLPELFASIAAIRLNAPELAIANVLGSNLFNMGFILFVDDIVMSTGTLWSQVSPVHALTAIAAIIMTVIVLVGLLTQLRDHRPRRFTIEAGSLIGCYIIVSFLVYRLGSV